ncbi:MAG TPA: hypothetical protein ENJ33_04660 [Thiothrix sp.]|nr:hypothetical protein [Thiothrix sp.]
MNRQQLVKYAQPLCAFIRLVKLITSIGVVFALIFYGLAINSYFNHEMYQAVFFASIAFISFHWLRRYVVSIASYLFRRVEGNDEVMDFIDQQLEGKQQRDFFIFLDKAMMAIKK